MAVGIPTSPIALLTNPKPESSAILIKQIIALETVDSTSGGAVINEAQFNLSLTTGGLNEVTVDNNIYVPLEKNNTGEGSHWITFVTPIPGRNSLIVIYSIKDSTYKGGYFWIQKALPQTYLDNFKLWLNGFATLPTLSRQVTKYIKFTFYGTTTNLSTQSTTLSIKLTGTVGGFSTGASSSTVLPIVR